MDTESQLWHTENVFNGTHIPAWDTQTDDKRLPLNGKVCQHFIELAHLTVETASGIAVMLHF